MKIICLNIWGGRVADKLFEFIQKYSDTDVFLFQEVFHNGTDITVWDNVDRNEVFREISELLPNHIGYFAPVESDEWGLASFVKKSYAVLEHGDVFIHRNRNAMIGRDAATLGRSLQYLKIADEAKQRTLINFHGLWNGKGKSDSDDRISQSQKTIDFIKTLHGDIVLCGDFNLRPDTQSMKMIEDELHLTNLITKHNITSTRSSLYGGPEKFADYILASENINVKHFEVLPDEVSDHLALFIEI